ncbi:hypothetical protein [Methanosarcina sp.]|uniref:hypothetical protein n=1 Tax=Methanosarcina sp. TaxID=2213 RepID=UPI003C75473A
MRKLVKASLIVLFLLVLGASLLYYHTDRLYHDSFTSSYDYGVTLRTDSELKNVTFYLPLPVYENESEIGKELISRGLQETGEWNLSILDTEHGKMLVLKTDSFVPEMYSPAVESEIPKSEEAGYVQSPELTYEIKENEMQDDKMQENNLKKAEVKEEELKEEELKEEELKKEKAKEEELLDASIEANSSENLQIGKPLWILVGLNSDSEINTRSPIGNEPVLNPAYNRSLSAYDMPYPENREPPAVYNYDSLIYADYEASPETQVSLLIDFSGWNEWWIYGWNGNRYSEFIYTDLNGSQQGWIQVPGKITMGDGNYR